MKRRGEIIRNEMHQWLLRNCKAIASLMGPVGNDLDIKGKDGVGPKSRIPWVRFFSSARSPNPREGWYCVYLFRANGSGFYLGLCHGATRWEGGEFKPRSEIELTNLVNWARQELSSDISNDPQLVKDIALDAPDADLGKAYERCTAVAIFYSIASIPSNNQLLKDAQKFARLLSILYDAEDLGRAPYSAELQTRFFEKRRDKVRFESPEHTSGQGFGLTQAERKAVELRAVELAANHLELEGFAIQDVSRNRPYDFIAEKDGNKFIVEVKGTTGHWRSIFLTHSEVAAHKKHHPLNVLLIVHSIILERRSKLPKASAGILKEFTGWTINDANLKALTYQYSFGKAP